MLTRRDFLVTAGTAVTGITAIGQTVDETFSKSVTVVRDQTLAPVSTTLEAPLRQNDIILSVSTVSTDEGFKQFLDSDVDVLHTTRPMLPSEAAAVDAAELEYEMFESTVDGVALLRSTKGWRSTLSTDGLAELRESHSEGQLWAELVPQDPSSSNAETSAPVVDTEPGGWINHTAESGIDYPRTAPLPDDTATVAVRGIRADQYAIGHGGLGYYEAEGADLMMVETADIPSDHAPIGRLRYTYVNADAFATASVTSFMRLFAARAWQTLSAGVPFADPTASISPLSDQRSSS